jgi:uncharacterized membrane protein YqjE
MASFASSHPLDTPGSAPRVVVEALAHRSELAALELREAQEHGLRTALFLGVAAVLALLGGFAANLAIAAAVWNRGDRASILAAVTAGYLVVAGALAYVGSRRLRTWHPFSETCRQFHEDCACIHDVIVSSAR